jgi:hypothetical protein
MTSSNTALVNTRQVVATIVLMEAARNSDVIKALSPKKQPSFNLFTARPKSPEYQHHNVNAGHFKQDIAQLRTFS